MNSQVSQFLDEEDFSSGSQRAKGDRVKMTSHTTTTTECSNQDEGKFWNSNTTSSTVRGESFSSWQLDWAYCMDLWKKFRMICDTFINNSRTQTAIIVLIVANAFMLGLATFDFVTEDPQVSHIFGVIDRWFLIVFTIESTLQLVVNGWRLFADGWLFFDFIVVILSWSLESLSVFRAFRVFRTIRLISRLKSLKNLLIALFQVGPHVAAIVCLLLLIIYIYGVLCTNLFRTLYEDGYSSVDYWGTLTKSFFTLLQMVTLTSWSDIVRETKAKYPWCTPIFIIFLVQTSFILYSLLIAVVCDAVKEVEHHDAKEAANMEDQLSKERLAQVRKHVHELAANQKLAMQSIQAALQQLEQISGLSMSESNDMSCSSNDSSTDLSTHNQDEADHNEAKRQETINVVPPGAESGEVENHVSPVAISDRETPDQSNANGTLNLANVVEVDSEDLEDHSTHLRTYSSAENTTAL